MSSDIRKDIFIYVAIFFSLLFSTATLFSMPGASAQHHGAPPPPASLGDRQVALNFDSSPKVINAGQIVTIKIGFEDLGKQQNVQQVTFRMEVSRDDKTMFSDYFYGPGGDVNLEFRPSESLPTVNGNDNGYGAWMADPGSPIIVNGKIFSDPGIYKTIVEVTGIDNIKTDLPEPLKYNFNIPIFVDQSFEVNYQNMKFNIKTISPVQISEAVFTQEKKQLVITSGDMINGSSQDFSIRVDMPREMMSGPFTAVLEDGTSLGVSENTTGSSMLSLIISGQKHDATMNMEGMKGNEVQHTHSIVISATTVVPEFPVGVAPAAVVMGIVVVILVTSRKSMFPAGKTY